MIYNGYDLRDYLRIINISGRGLRNNEIYLHENRSKDGAIFRRKRKPPLPITVQVEITGNNRTEILDKLDIINKILDVDDVVPIIFHDEPNKTYYGIVSTITENMENEFQHKATINIICPDPYKYKGGKINLELVRIYQEFEILGSAKTEWESRTIFSQNENSFRLENEGEGAIVLDYNFISGDILEIEYKKRKISLNGNPLQTAFNVEESKWFILNPGKVKLRASTLTTLSYTEKW